MITPPAQLDGAEVLAWTVSPSGCFYVIPGGPTPVAAMAICRYSGAGGFYLFKCAADWTVVMDWLCATTDEAKEMAAAHAGTALVWESAKAP